MTRDEYVIRPSEPGDGEDYVSIYEEAWGGDPSPEWYEWKYERNPFRGSATMFVAESGGEVVGARPFIPLQFRAGDERALGLLATDTVVRSDHRRQGLFSRMTETALDAFSDAEPEFTFNFPNEKSLPGYLKFGWHDLGQRTTSYRVQRPGAFVRRRLDGDLGDALSQAANRTADGAFGVLDRFGRPSREFSVERRDDPPLEELASLYERAVPDELHVQRDEDLYRWWLANPRKDQTTYLVTDRGEPVAGIVTENATHEDDSGGVPVTYLIDVVPMVGDERQAAIAAGIDRVLADNERSALVIAPEPIFPPGVMRAYGFLPDDSPPLDRMGTEIDRITVRSLRADGRWKAANRTLGDPSNWLSSFIERA